VIRLLLAIPFALGLACWVFASSQLESPNVDTLAIDYAAVPLNETPDGAALAIIGGWAVVPRQDLALQVAPKSEVREIGNAAPFVIQNTFGQFGLSDGTILITARLSEDLNDIAIDYGLTLKVHFSGTNMGQFASTKSVEEVMRVLDAIKLDHRVVSAGLNSAYHVARPN